MTELYNFLGRFTNSYSNTLIFDNKKKQNNLIQLTGSVAYIMRVAPGRIYYNNRAEILQECV